LKKTALNNQQGPIRSNWPLFIFLPVIEELNLNQALEHRPYSAT
jgi:hypothetical protein